MSINPTTEVDLPKLTEPEAQNLKDTEVERIVEAAASRSEAAASRSLLERNIALIAVLLHGLRAEEVSALNLEDYDRQQLRIWESKADSKGWVPLNKSRKGVRLPCVFSDWN